MEFVIPDWLNRDFMQRIFSVVENNDSVNMIDFVAEPAVDKGENYGSVMMRCNVEYSVNGSTQKKSVIMKFSPLAEGPQKVMFEETKIFDREVKMVTSTLNKMETVLNEKSFRLKATTLYTEMGDPSLIVMEDLIPLAFRTANRSIGLNLDESLMAIRRLAAFHASSVAVYENDPQEMIDYNGGLCNVDYPQEWKDFFTSAFKNLGQEVATWQELGPRAEIYARAFTDFAGEMYVTTAQNVRPKENDFNVLNHGDYWTTNMLFNYKDGKVVDHIFIDFQMCFWGSPAIDLLYHMNTSLSEDVDIHHQDRLIEEYLSSLTATMKKINCKTRAPSLTELKKALREKAMLGLISGSIIMPLMRIDKKHVKTTDEMFDSELMAEVPTYKNPNYRKIMLRKLPYWDSLGLFDF